jgi:Reverse transcriptase (RNA-dependent DNA polymerase)
VDREDRRRTAGQRNQERSGFHSYLVGRRTTYKWNAFTSGSYPADVGVGQGSAMSPVLSALYLAPVIKLFVAHVVSRKTDLMSYVDDGLLIARSRRLEDNLRPLQEAYGWIHRAFEALGLVVEHSKSEAFHFSRARANLALPIHLGFAPFTGDTPFVKAKPKQSNQSRFVTRKSIVETSTRCSLSRVRALRPKWCFHLVEFVEMIDKLLFA